jgi:hypothetical protein
LASAESLPLENFGIEPGQNGRGTPLQIRWHFFSTFFTLGCALELACFWPGLPPIYIPDQATAEGKGGTRMHMEYSIR